MKIIRNISKAQQISHELKMRGRKIAVVPTMGALHEGHLSLIRIAKKHADMVFLTVFVNPAQFSPNEDFNKYPRTFPEDKRLAENENVDYCFYPEKSQMYDNDFETYINCERNSLILEGEFRPIHFKGVTTIVAKLFNIIDPDIAVFGQKDAQQAFIIRKMVKDLNFNIKIITAPILRDKDGLALSSRNIYLSPEERNDALILNESLQFSKKMIIEKKYSMNKIYQIIEDKIKSKKTSKIDYIKIVDSISFSPLTSFNVCKDITILLAVKFSNTRLIDNLRIKLK